MLTHLFVSELHLRRSLKECVIEETPTTPELDLVDLVLYTNYSEEVQLVQNTQSVR